MIRKILMLLALCGVLGFSVPSYADEAKPVDAAAGPAGAPAAAPAAAAPAAPPAPTEPVLVTNDKISAGDTAWMLTSTALVLLMTIPGLALFYGGMVRKKNVLATLMQSFAITCLVTILWWLIGYSLAFTPGGTAYLGSFSRAFMNGAVYLKDAGKTSVSHLGLTVPETVYAMFQLTFAIITPALIAGAFAERMKFSAMLWFMGIWSIVVYAPIAHWVWEPSGWLAAKAGAARGWLGLLPAATRRALHARPDLLALPALQQSGRNAGGWHAGR